MYRLTLLLFSVAAFLELYTYTRTATGMPAATSGFPVCPEGFYGVNCSLACHVNCGYCRSSGLCDTCQHGNVHGALCDQPCSLCKNGACDRLGCKDGCIEGFFQQQSEKLPGQPQSYRCVKCPDSCEECESADKCTRCIHRRWGRLCEGSCNKIKNCLKCKCESQTCESKDLSCYECESGFTGDKCQLHLNRSEHVTQTYDEFDRHKGNKDNNYSQAELIPNNQSSKDYDFNPVNKQDMNNWTSANELRQPNNSDIANQKNGTFMFQYIDRTYTSLKMVTITILKLCASIISVYMGFYEV